MHNQIKGGPIFANAFVVDLLNAMRVFFCKSNQQKLENVKMEPQTTRKRYTTDHTYPNVSCGDMLDIQYAFFKIKIKYDDY